MNAGNRCRRCGKVIFASCASANAAAAGLTKIYRDKKHKMRAYRGPCGFWHTTRTKTLNEIREKLGILQQEATR